MPRYESSLLERRSIAEGTTEFVFERPAGFEFRAGQAVTLALPNPPYTDVKGNRRTFSIASPPQEQGRIEIASRTTESAMKKSLAEVPIGTKVQMVGPFGTLTLHEAAGVPAVLIAGGIGITPMRSMVLEALASERPRPMSLIYSNRKPEEAAYHEEFARLAARYECLTYVPTMTQAESSGRAWEGERRRVDADFIRKVVGDLAGPVFYVVGPPRMVEGVMKALNEAGANPEQIRSEEFAGY